MTPPKDLPLDVPDWSALNARIADRSAKVAVLGQGYVGLTLAAAAAAEGFPVVGIDVDEARTESLAAGELVVPGVDPDEFRAGVESGNMTFSSSPDPVADADIVLICVPTPVSDHAPDLRYVESAGSDVGAHVRPGTLVVLESTTYPGTTDSLLRPILEFGSRLQAGTDFLLAYSPERVDPGSAQYHMRNTPRVVGGSTPEATEIAVAFYGTLVDKVVPVSTTRAAETSKLLENTFRHINIALVNEMAMVCHEMGIDIWEVIDAAATKPFGYMPFYPGPGIGGHCIPLDPTYLAWQIRRESGRRFAVLEASQDVNERMPNWVASRVAELLNDQHRSVRTARVLVLGVSYKADVGDVRESPALLTMQLLHQRGADVRFHDFYVDEVRMNGGMAVCVQDLDTELEEADVVLLLTPHSAYDLESIASRARIVLDTRNAFGSDRRPNIVPL